jgi:hypothetical protein
MQQATKAAGAQPLDATASQHHERRVNRLIDRLPRKLQKIIRWLRRPAARWARIPVGLLLITGSFLSILPFFGLWMLPLGLLLLAEDIRPLGRIRDRLLALIERHRPEWFHSDHPEDRMQLSSPHSSSVAGSVHPAKQHQ